MQVSIHQDQSNVSLQRDWTRESRKSRGMSLEDRIGELVLDYKYKEIFVTPSNKDNSNKFKDVLQWASTPSGMASLSRYYEQDRISYIRATKSLGDGNGTLSILLLNSFKEKEVAVESILDLLKRIIKDELETKALEWYMKLYYVLSLEYNTFIPLHLAVLSSYLDNESLSLFLLMILMKCLQKSPLDTTAAVEDYFGTFDLEHPATSDFVKYVKSLCKLFPILTPLISKLYMDGDFLTNVLRYVTKEQITPGNTEITIALLQLISSSCTNEQCRTFNAKNYLPLLQTGTTVDKSDGSGFEEMKVLSALCIIKIWNFVETSKSQSGETPVTVLDLYYILVSNLKETTDMKDNNTSYTVEGLAYLTLNTTVRKYLRQDVQAIDKIVDLIKDPSHFDTSFKYGLILILTNLCKIKEKNSTSDSKTKNFLKSISVPDKNSKTNDSGSETEDEIKLFNKSLLVDYKIIDVVSKVKVIQSDDPSKTNGSSNRISKLVVALIHLISIIREPNVRRQLVAQGALLISIEYLMNHSKVSTNKECRPVLTSDEEIETRLNCIRSMARMIVAINPKTAFTKYDVKTYVPFLVELLGINISRYSSTLIPNSGDNEDYLNDVTNIDKHESLLALTNLSSDLSNKSLRLLIILRTFEDFLTNFMIETDIPQIQRAAWELVSNLISDPLLLAKFFNLEKKENRKRLELLIKFLQVEDEELQIVIAGLVSNATSEFQMVDEIIVEDSEICDALLIAFDGIIKEQNSVTELIKRISYILANLVFAVSDSRAQIIKLKSHPLLQSCLQNLVINNKSNPEISGSVMEILGLLKSF